MFEGFSKETINFFYKDMTTPISIELQWISIDKINTVYRKINAKALYLTTKSNTLYKKIKKFKHII